ncbi:MAG TPA: ATP synthase F0 subunit B [Blastocatellia bacterium]|nr:ATP synthase F0 subunit B [Blastocatellia bacterium]
MITNQFIALALMLFDQAEEQKSFWANPTYWRVINLIIFVAALVFLLRNKIRIGEVFDKRADSIRKQLEEARSQKDEAERRLAEVESRLSRLDEELANIKAAAEQEGQREVERIMKAADADAEKIGQTAQREIEGAMKAAKSDLRAFVAEQSVQLAESMILSDLRPDDSNRLVARYIDDLGEVKR